MHNVHIQARYNGHMFLVLGRLLSQRGLVRVVIVRIQTQDFRPSLTSDTCYIKHRFKHGLERLPYYIPIKKIIRERESSCICVALLTAEWRWKGHTLGFPPQIPKEDADRRVAV